MAITSLLLTLALQNSITPAERLNQSWWKERHEKAVEVTKKGGFRVAFVGDSITQGWESNGKAAWDATFAPLGAANFGFSGDQTQHVLWRLQNGELIGAKPEVVVIMIGTNNIGNGSGDPAATAEGVKAIVGLLRSKLPETRILLLGIFPRSRKADEGPRLKVAEATRLFAPIADGKHVVFSDIGRYFIRENGDLRDTLMPDLLHLSPGGYEIWAKAIASDVKRLLSK